MFLLSLACLESVRPNFSGATTRPILLAEYDPNSKAEELGDDDIGPLNDEDKEFYPAQGSQELGEDENLDESELNSEEELGEDENLNDEELDFADTVSEDPETETPPADKK